MADTGQGDSNEPFVLMEMSLRDLLGGRRIDHADFLARVDLLGALGKSVLISSHGRHFRLVPYLRQYTKSRIAFAMGVPNLRELCEDKYYTDLGGGILEGAGRLFQTGVKLYVYPSKDSKTGKLITAETMSVAPRLRHLQAYLLENQLIESIRNVDEKQLGIFPRDVLAKIQSGDPAWETMVPPQAVEIIKAQKFFGYKSSAKSP